jgi:DNA-binding response OmpR family regulator
MAQKPFILLVEDDAKLRRIIARNLEESGYMVTEADSFSEAVDRIYIKPDLMILDINLPDASGWDVASWLESQTSPVPIIVISGLKLDPGRLAHLQPKAFLAKPFDIEHLLRLVEEHAPVA